MKTKRLLFILFTLLPIIIHSCKVQSIDPSQPSRDDNMVLGNPSQATPDPANENNFLMVKDQYTLSYNLSRGTANWVSWHVSKAWKGEANRQNNFHPDNTLPKGWYKVTPGDYTNTGFDRGHLCPSDDRDANAEDNSSTFLMTNIVPQSPDNNRNTWRALEEYSRSLLNATNELYIIAGVYGEGGSGANGGVTKTIADKKVTVPARLWKVIVVLPVGQKDLNRINASTRIISVDMPNNQSVDNLSWDKYRVSVDAIEASTGYNLLSTLPESLQSILETKVDNTPVGK